MEGSKIMAVLFLVLCLPLGMALDFNPQVAEVDLYSSTANVLRQGSLNSIDSDLRIFIPRQADIETLLIDDEGAVLVQLTVESEIPDDLTRSVEAQLLRANLGKNVTLVTDQYSASGSLKEVVRDEYVILSNPVISDGGLSVPAAQDLVLAISSVSSMSLSVTPDVLEKDELQDLLAKQVLTLRLQPSRASRDFSMQYFVSGAGWNPVYQLFVEEDNDETAEFVYQANASNQTDEDWTNVKLKLIAGMPNLKYSPYYRGYDEYDYMAEAYKSAVPMATGSFDSGETGELHTYTLNRTFSLKKQSNAVIPVLTETIPIEKKYVWEAQWSNTVQQQVNLKNTSEEPWANGWVSSYQDGTYIGGANLSWLAVDDNTDLTIGKAPNITVKRIQKINQDNKPGYTVTVYDTTLHLENHKKKAVEVEVRDYLPSDAQNFYSSQPYEQGEGNQIFWRVSLAPGEEKDIVNRYSTVYYRSVNPVIPAYDEGVRDAGAEGYAMPPSDMGMAQSGGWLGNIFQPFLSLFGFR